MARKESEWEDFEEFEKQVDEISKLIKDLSSGNISCEELDQSLGIRQNEDQRKSSNFAVMAAAENDAGKQVEKTQKTLSVNIKPPAKPAESLDNMQAGDLSQDAFMRMVEEDARRRSKERAERNEKASILMKKGNAAFRERCFERALRYFNEAIDTRRDSSLLYTNRAVTYLRLGLFTRSVEDCERAIKLKDTLKPHLLKCKALEEMGDTDAYEAHVQVTREAFPEENATITEYLKSAE